MRASGVNHPAPGKAKKRVCAALGFKRATANGAAFQLNSKYVDFAEIWTLPTHLLPLFKGGFIRKGATQLHNLQNRAFHKITRTCIAHVDSDCKA